MSTVDVHCHLAPPALSPLLDGVDAVEITGDRVHVGDRSFPFPPELTNPQALWDRMGRDGWAVVSPPPPFYRYELAAGSAEAYARALNEALREVAATFPRAALLGWLPLQSPQASLDEIRKLSAQRDVVGIVVGTSPHLLSEPQLDPVWRALAEAGMGIFVHPNGDPFGSSCIPNRGPVLGFPVETTRLALDLLFSESALWEAGVGVCLAHGGGFLAAAFPRALRAAGGEAGRHARPRLERLWVDSVIFGSEWRGLIAGSVGEDRILPGTDWPYGMRIDDQSRDVSGDASGEGPLTRAGRWCPRLSELVRERVESSR